MPRAGRTFVGVYGPVDPVMEERRQRNGVGQYECILIPPDKTVIEMQQYIVNFSGPTEPYAKHRHSRRSKP